MMLQMMQMMLQMMLTPFPLGTLALVQGVVLTTVACAASEVFFLLF